MCYVSLLIIVTSLSDVIVYADASKYGGDVRRSRDSLKPNLLASDNEYGPVWTRDMDSKAAVYMQPVHSTVRLRCDADGRPRPTITWYKDGQEAMSRQFGKIEQRRYSLKVSDLMTFDSGNYTCVVSNRHGQLRHTYVLDVFTRTLSAPVITKPPVNQTVTLGDNVTLHCRFHSDIEAYIHWFKLRDDVITDRSSGQSELAIDWNSFAPIQTEMEDGVLDPRQLVLNNVTLSDAGTYACHVTNTFGDVSSSAILTVVQPTATYVVRERLFVNASHHLYVVIAVALSSPLIITTLVVISMLLHRRRWLDWRKSSVPVHHRQRSQTSPALQQLLQPTDARWELNPTMIKEHQLLGEGAFGQVYKATVCGLPNAGKQTVAIKKLKATASEAEIRAFINEVNVMKSVGRHVNVIAFIGCCTKLGQGGGGVLRAAVEYARHGNLRDFVRRNRPVSVAVTVSQCHSVNSSVTSVQCQQCLDETLTPSCHRIPLTSRHLLSFGHQAARGMQFLASNKIIHRDLAARNVLVADKLVIKIADFGLTRVVDASADCYRQHHDPLSRVPMKWMAPESLTHNIYTTNTDVWSYGVVLWEIFTYGETPYPSLPVESLSRLLQTGYRMKKPRLASKHVYDVMLRCWALKPDDRPTFTQLTQQLDLLLANASSTKYLQLDDAETLSAVDGTADTCSATDSYSSCSCDTQSSVVASQTSDVSSSNCSRSAAAETVSVTVGQQQQQQQQTSDTDHHHHHHHHHQHQHCHSALGYPLSPPAYDDRSQLLMATVTE